MKILILILFQLINANTASASEFGFAKGSDFQSYTAYGPLTVQCKDGGSHAQNSETTFTCRDSFLLPQVFDYFKGPVTTQGNIVNLSARSEQGGIVMTASASYDGAKGLSREPFNLWLSSPIQQSLLREGVNRLSFEIISGKRIVQQGDFAVVVKRTNPKKCAPLKLVSGRGEDCESPFSMCQRYFKEQNYCL